MKLYLLSANRFWKSTEQQVDFTLIISTRTKIFRIFSFHVDDTYQHKITQIKLYMPKG